MMRRLLWLGLISGLLWSGCDTAPGPPSIYTNPPAIGDLSLNPSTLIFESLPDEQIEGDTIVVPIALSVRVDDLGDKGIREVRYVIQDPFNGLAPLYEGTLQVEGDRYQRTIEFRLNRSQTGIYPVLIYPIGESGLLGNRIQSQITFQVLTNNPPVITAIEAPDTVQRPASGTANFAIIAVVEDPDGLPNIRRVLMTTESGAEFDLRDDGGQNSNSGDATAGDGRFTLTVQISASNALGPNTFTFQAFDRAGLASDSLQKTITITD